MENGQNIGNILTLEDILGLLKWITLLKKGMLRKISGKSESNQKNV